MALNLDPGTRIGRYEVTATIGEGGMGELYRARDTKRDRDVALKVLPQAFTEDPDRLARLEREAKVLATLNHPNIGAIYGLEKFSDTGVLVLELVEGPTLADRIAKGPIPLDEALAIAKRVEEALEAAHRHGIVHGDLTPVDVRVTNDGHVKVLGFGYGRVVSDDPEVDTQAFEALCELLLGMKSPSTRAARPMVSKETASIRRPIPLTTWMWLRRLAAALISFALAASLFDVIWPNAVPELEAPLRSLVWVDRAGNEESIEVGVGGFANPRLSPDNQVILVEVEDDDHDLWMYDVVRQTAVRLTVDSAADVSPVCGLDGWVTFASARDGGVLNIFRKRTSGPGPAERLTRSLNTQVPGWVSADGQLLVEERDADGQWDIRLLPLDGQDSVETLLFSSFNGRQPAVSPLGRWLAYASDISGRDEVYVRPFPDVDEGLWQVSTNSGTAPLWARDGRELFYREGKSVMVVTVASWSPDGDPVAKNQENFNTLTVSEPQVLFGPVYWAGEGRSYASRRMGGS